MSAVNKEGDDSIYKNFYSHGHHGLQDVNIQLIEKVNVKDNLGASVLRKGNGQRSLKPDGLNESDFFFSPE